MTPLWGVLAAAALLWPDHVTGLFDGMPLDRTVEAIGAGVLLPVLWWLHPRFLNSRGARVLIVALLVWRITSTVALSREGWCVRFEPGQPYVVDQTGAPHAWDVRADWRTPDPGCSAIMTRPYRSFAEFPAWFFNLPPPNESWPGPLDRPPGATTRMTVRGYIEADEPGTLRIDRGAGVAPTVSIDGRVWEEGSRLEPGTHLLFIDAVLTGEEWRLDPTWNGVSIWSNRRVLTSLRRPSSVDAIVRHWLGWVPALIAFAILGTWTASTIASMPGAAIWGWSSMASAVIAALILGDRVEVARWMVLGLAAGALIPVPRDGAKAAARAMIGLPWLTFVVASAAPAIGRFVVYDWGHDYWMFQRFAYRIVMQGHWIEGGSPTFWFQPLYRWIVAALHLMFGDSSVGEWFWDGACLLAGATFVFHIVNEFAGFRWGIAAAAIPLGVFVLGTPQYLIGRGLGEISSSGFIYAAALAALRSRDGSNRWAVAAGALMTLAFYTRLNNLPMVAGVMAIAASRRMWRPALTIAAVVAAGTMLFALRTWYYTGVFSIFHGTQRELLAVWQPGVSIAEGLRRTLESVLMVLTVNDPPRFDVYAVPVLAGAACALLALIRMPRLRTIPLSTAILCLSALAGAFVARGTSYPGRFSIHLIPAACAMTMCGVAALLRTTPAVVPLESHDAE